MGRLSPSGARYQQRRDRRNVQRKRDQAVESLRNRLSSLQTDLDNYPSATAGERMDMLERVMQRQKQDERLMAQIVNALASVIEVN